MIFFKMLFRSASELSQGEMLRAAQSQYEKNRIQKTILNILIFNNESLMNLMNLFFKTRQKKKKTWVICFFEQKSSNVEIILDESWSQMCDETLYEMHSWFKR